MYFGFIFGLGTGTSLKANICIPTIGTDGTKHGFLKDSFGTITPNATLEGVDIYEATWQADGTFIISFGDGATQIPNVTRILVVHHTVPDGNMAIWNSSTSQYEFIDSTLANYIIDEGLTEICFYVELIPDELVRLSMGNIQIGTKV